LDAGRFVFRSSLLIIATWSHVRGVSVHAEKTSCCAYSTLGAVVLPAYVTTTILSRTMNLAA